MVVSNTFNFYSEQTRPVTSESKQHIASASHSSSMDMKKEGVTVNEIPLNDLPPTPTKSLNKQATVRRSQELARPKRKAKPRPLDRLYRTCADQSMLVRGVIIFFVTSIPFVIFAALAATVFSDVLVGPSSSPLHQAPLEKLGWSLLVWWGSFILLLYIGRVVSLGVRWVCIQSTALERYKSLAQETCLRVTLLLWAAVGYATLPSFFENWNVPMPDPETQKNWQLELRRAFMFLLIAFGVILLQGIVLRLIGIQFIEAYIAPRTEKASHELEVLKDLKHLVSRHLSSDDLGIVARFFKALIMPTNSNDLYYIISHGEGDEEKWQEYAGNIWQEISKGKSSLTMQDITSQLIVMNRDPERGRDLFLQLDESLDGQITEDEVTKLVRDVGLQLNRRSQAFQGINHLMQKLEIVLSILMLGLIVFIYVQFFASKETTAQLGTLWTGIVALSFAFSGTVLEFTNATVFCFGKHPYDIGDFVEIKTKKYIVSKIYLTHTNFEQVMNEDVRGLVVQMSHASLMGEPIVNWTRTCEDAIRRHKKGEEEGGARDEGRNEAAAELVLAKLGRLKEMGGEKVVKVE